MNKNMAIRVLVIGSIHPVINGHAKHLSDQGIEFLVSTSFPEGISLAEVEKPKVVLMTGGFKQKAEIDFIKRLRKTLSGATLIVVNDSMMPCMKTAVDVMQAGADEYLFQPIETARLIETILAYKDNELSLRGRTSGLQDGSRGDSIRQIIGNCEQIQDLRTRILQIGAVDRKSKRPRPVLITGETGTGKQLVAQALHLGGDRAQQPFIEVNCGAIPSSLLEAELFGYEKGAFTDAKTAKAGLFEEAQGGTLFLDEICSMDPLLQVKLLKVIEDKQVRRIGSTKAKPIDVRIIAASNWVGDLALRNQKIRPDLYYRLHAFSFLVPPLRERGGDISLLSHYTLDRLSREFNRDKQQLSSEAEEALYAYRWPGNVRELIHVIERAALLHEGETILVEHLELDHLEVGSSLTIDHDGNVQIDFSKSGINLEGVERQLILRALVQAEWNRTKASRLLGISKETLRYRMEKFNLTPPKDIPAGQSVIGSLSLVHAPR